MIPLPIQNSAVLLGSIAVAAALIYFPYLFVVSGRVQVGYDMRAPRSTFDQLPDYAKRATWAHQNSFETFMVYTAAALMAYATGQTTATAAWSAIAFVIARFFFSVCYIANIPVGRSLMFGVGSAATLNLFILSIQSVL
jgi:uncharacterized MAPEG superfamily protein